MGYKKLGKDILLMTIGNFASKIVVFLILPLYTAYLTTSDYGTADLITTTCTLLFPLFTLIIGESMMRFALEKSCDKDQIYSIGVRVWLAGTCIFLLLSPIIRAIPTLKDCYWFLVIYYIVYSFQNTLSYFIRGINKVKIYAIGGTLNTFVLVILNVLFLVKFRLGLTGYLYSYILTGIFMCLWWFTAGRLFELKLKLFRFDKSLAKRMLQYSVPMVPNSLSWWVSNSSDKYILLYFSGVAANGIYSVAYKIPTIIITVSNIFMSAWRLSSVEEFGSEKSIVFWNDIFKKFVFVMMCTTSLILVCNKFLAGVLYSNAFYSAWKYVPVLVIASVLHSYSEFIGTMYLSSMKTKILFYSTGVGAVSNIILNIILIPHFLAMGAAIATMCSYGITFLIRLHKSRKIMKLEIGYARAVACYLAIVLQTVIASVNLKYETAISCILCIFVLSVMLKEIRDVLNMVLKKIPRLNKGGRL